MIILYILIFHLHILITERILDSAIKLGKSAVSNILLNTMYGTREGGVPTKVCRV